MNMVKRTEHGEERHEETERPTSEAEQDKTAASEIYLDIESMFYVFIGEKGRTHIFTNEGLHHTSFRTTKMNRSERVKSGKWEIIHRNDLPNKLK
ncbi:MAG: hypothetical protein M3405_08410 [Acidobacteriota bacterium]|nr:hypothetical protein [Acidobacteriota bacterium]